MTNKEWLDYLAHNAPDELAAWFDAEHVETEERAYGKGGLVGGSFIDIPEQGEVVMPLESWRDHLDTESESEDSRERLEADVRNFAEKSGWLYPMAGTRIVLEWLDRQAAITERECRKPNWDYCETCETLAELTAEREAYREKFGKCIDYADAIHALMDEGLA